MLFLESFILCFNSCGNCVEKRGCPFMITKTCRFAARRARPASYKGGCLGEMCAPSYSCCNNTFNIHNILYSFYIHLITKRSLPEIAGQFRALAAKCSQDSQLHAALEVIF